VLGEASGHFELVGGGTAVHLFRRKFFSLKGAPGGVGGHIELGGGGGRGPGFTCFIANFATGPPRRGQRSSGLKGEGALGQHRGVGPKQASGLISDRFGIR
jgi:hypothetical protein